MFPFKNQAGPVVACENLEGKTLWAAKGALLEQRKRRKARAAIQIPTRPPCRQRAS